IPRTPRPSRARTRASGWWSARAAGSWLTCFGLQRAAGQIQKHVVQRRLMGAEPHRGDALALALAEYASQSTEAAPDGEPVALAAPVHRAHLTVSGERGFIQLRVRLEFHELHHPELVDERARC